MKNEVFGTKHPLNAKVSCQLFQTSIGQTYKLRHRKHQLTQPDIFQVKVEVRSEKCQTDETERVCFRSNAFVRVFVIVSVHENG